MNTFDKDCEALLAFMETHRHLVVLTGAGISADSGIPTYRDHSGTWLHREPIQERDFLADADTRRRYWARSWHGWPAVRDAAPNPAHHALAQLEAQGRVRLVITQNVDRLHQRAGSRRVVDLHGRLDRVRCLTCEEMHDRDHIQALFEGHNEQTLPEQLTPRPDGDMDVPEEAWRDLALPGCRQCAGDLMPDVVFFGGSVPRDRVDTCMQALADADALLAIGSSLKVFSGFRFCRRARELGLPLAIINPGITRADDLAALKLSAPAGPLLSAATSRLTAAAQPQDIRSV